MSLRTLDGFQRFDYDYLGRKTERREATRRAMARWRRVTPRSELEDREAVLMDPKTGLRLSDFNALVRQRDGTPVFLAE